jgi:hypothetical protein
MKVLGILGIALMWVFIMMPVEWIERAWRLLSKERIGLDLMKSLVVDVPGVARSLSGVVWRREAET